MDKKYSRKKKPNKLVNLSLPEKKIWLSAGQGGLGQVNDNNDGSFTQNINPVLKCDATSSGRIGNKITVTSGFVSIMYNNKNLQTAPVKIKTYLIYRPGTIYNNYGDMLEEFLKPNPYIAALNVGAADIYDYFSPRNNKFFKGFRVLATKTVTMKGDTVSNQNQQVEVKLGFKNKKISMRWLTDSTTVSSEPSDGAFYIVSVCDRGNYGSGTCTLAGVTDLSGTTGYAVYYNATLYYTDD